MRSSTIVYLAIQERIKITLIFGTIKEFIQPFPDQFRYQQTCLYYTVYLEMNMVFHFIYTLPFYTFILLSYVKLFLVYRLVPVSLPDFAKLRCQIGTLYHAQKQSA